MNKNFKDITGQKFERLTVIKIAGKDKGRNYKWLCQCDCGNILKVVGNSLRMGRTKSCGCLQKKWAKKHGGFNKTHGMKDTIEYTTWLNMKSRCLNKNNKRYKDYGGRGITICKEWENSFETFYKDMGKRLNEMSIDRVDNNKGYSKENCRWATNKEQARNTRRNKMVAYKGENFCLKDWAKKLDIKYTTLWYRLKRGWSVKRAFTN